VLSATSVAQIAPHGSAPLHRHDDVPLQGETIHTFSSRSVLRGDDGARIC